MKTERANSCGGVPRQVVSMKVSSAQRIGSADVASSGSSSAQTGKADASFASLLGVDDGDRREALPAKDSAGTKQGEPGHKDVKDRDRKGGSPSSLNQTGQTGLVTNAQPNPANLNVPLLAGGVAPAADKSAEIPAATSSAVLKSGTGTSDSLNGALRASTPAAESKAGTGSNPRTVPAQGTAAIGVAVDGDANGGLFSLPAMDENGEQLENSSKPAITNSKTSLVDSGADASNGTAKTGVPEVNLQFAVAAPELAEPAASTAFQSSQDVSHAGRVDAANPPEGSGTTEGTQAGTVAGVGMVSPGTERPATSTTAVSFQADAMGQASGQQPAGTNARGSGVPSVAAPGGNQLAGNGGQAHGNGSGGAADSSGSADPAPQAPDSKNVLTAADLTQIARGGASATPVNRGGAASASNTSSSTTQSGVQPMSDAGVARVLQSAMRGDVRVGVQTEAFGRVTIQTIAGDGQLSAQLSLENVKQSAALAVHLPAVEQKLTQQYGLNASVSLAGGSSRDAGSMMSDGGRGSNPNNSYQQNDGSSAGVRGERFNSFSPAASNVPAISSVSPRYRGSLLSARLDITV